MMLGTLILKWTERREPLGMSLCNHILTFAATWQEKIYLRSGVDEAGSPFGLPVNPLVPRASSRQMFRLSLSRRVVCSRPRRGFTRFSGR